MSFQDNLPRIRVLSLEKKGVPSDSQRLHLSEVDCPRVSSHHLRGAASNNFLFFFLLRLRL